jgi:hypothetical protein
LLATTHGTGTDVSDAPDQERYRFGYTGDGVYGRAVDLVLEHARSAGVHLDLGCGFGAVADPLRDAGLTYVGADRDPASLNDLADRGFETIEVDLEDVPATVAALNKMLAGRDLASLSLLDTLEHLRNGPALLAALHAMADESRAPLVVSVPNIAHRDIALKLITGRFDLTETGLLDSSHLVHHTERLLADRMVEAGWREVDARDVHLERSDQSFPADHAVLSPASTVHRFLARLRQAAGAHAETNQFVRAYLPGAARTATVATTRDDGETTFLTVVVRTQGKRQETLRDALLCLVGQTVGDFEVVVAVHRASAEEQTAVNAVVGELPASMRARLRVLAVEGGGRSRPLNAAFATARGRYVAVLDDDDLVFGHWVETFVAAAAKAPGAVLRTVSVEQPIEPVSSSVGKYGISVIGPMTLPYPASFDLLDHMARNHTPFMAYAFPRALHRDLGLRFDERLDICEDWDYELRAALLAGVVSVPQVTAVYRRWTSGHSSASLHSADEWRRTERAILAKIDSEPHVWPAGTIAAIREATSRARRQAKRDIEALIERNRELEEHALRMERSASWRLTAPLRALRNLARRQP